MSKNRFRRQLIKANGLKITGAATLSVFLLALGLALLRYNFQSATAPWSIRNLILPFFFVMLGAISIHFLLYQFKIFVFNCTLMMHAKKEIISEVMGHFNATYIYNENHFWHFPWKPNSWSPACMVYLGMDMHHIFLSVVPGTNNAAHWFTVYRTSRLRIDLRNKIYQRIKIKELHST